MNNRLQDLLVGILAGIYRPPTDLSLLEWAEREIVLGSEESIDHAGPYSSALTPWHAFIFECFQDPQYRELIIRKSSQTGVTLSILIIITYMVAEMPAHVLYAIDSLSEAKKISKKRLIPMLEKTRACSDAMDVPEDDLATLFLMVRGMTIDIIGGGSAGAFANKTVKLCVLDELDKHPDNPQGEADTIDLARDRMKAVEDAMLIGFSSPKGYEDKTNQEYLTGTRHKMFVPCPHCGTLHDLVWEHVRFDHCKDLLGNWVLEQVLEDTFYECPHCKERIDEKWKPWMFSLDRVQFLPTNLNLDDHKRVPSKASLHIGDLYSQLPTSTWGKLAVEFIDASRNPAKLQAFFNGRMGEPKKKKEVEVEKNDVYKLVGAYEHGTCPVYPAFTADGRPSVFTTGDVQKDVYKYVKGVFNKRDELWITGYGETLSIDELEAVGNEPVLCGPDQRPYAGSFGWLDEGHKTKDVRDFCLRSGGKWWPVKGRGGIQVKDVVVTSPIVHEDRELVAYHISDDDFKTELYVGRIGEIDKIKSGESPIPRMWLPLYVEERFVAELCAEKRERRRKQGKMVWVWADPTDPNDYGDAVKYLLALWYKIKGLFIHDLPEDLREKDDS